MMNKEIDVNSFCKVDGTATKDDAKELYNHLKSNTSDDTMVVLDFSNIKLVNLAFFKTLLMLYYPDFENLRFQNLSEEQTPLFKEAFSCLREGVL